MSIIYRNVSIPSVDSPGFFVFFAPSLLYVVKVRRQLPLEKNATLVLILKRFFFTFNQLSITASYRSSMVVAFFYYRLINIALRYTRLLNTLKYICMRRGVSIIFTRFLYSLFFHSCAFSSFLLLRGFTICPYLRTLDLFLDLDCSSALTNTLLSFPIQSVCYPASKRYYSSSLPLLCSPSVLLTYSAFSASSSLPLLRGNNLL